MKNKHAKVAYNPKSEPTHGITEATFYGLFGGRRENVREAYRDKGHPLHKMVENSIQASIC